MLDCFSEIYVWIGALSTPSEKNWALLKAEELAQRNRPECCRIVWVMDGAETIVFREQFEDWTDDIWELELDRTGSVTPMSRGSGSGLMPRMESTARLDSGSRSACLFCVCCDFFFLSLFFIHLFIVLLVLLCFVLCSFVLFCFVLLCFVLCSFVLFCFVSSSLGIFRC